MGTLFIVSTPIGNLEDITIRAIRALLSVDIIVCEDTRHTGLLINELKKRFSSNNGKDSDATHFNNIYYHTKTAEKPSRLIRFDDKTEQQKTPEVIQLLLQGFSVALVSNAGTPLVSDPGFRLVNEALKHNIKVTSVPGPCAAVAALSICGLPSNHFLFLGYPPEKPIHRINLFKSLLSIHRCIDSTYILYSAPHKLEQTLADMEKILGDVRITITRELTKIHEEIWRGTISQALSEARLRRGELVILFWLD